MNGNKDGAFRLVVVYAPTGRPDFFTNQEAFLRISRPLVLVGDWNCIFDARMECVDLVEWDVNASKTCSGLSSFLIGTDWVSLMCQCGHGATTAGRSDSI